MCGHPPETFDEETLEELKSETIKLFEKAEDYAKRAALDVGVEEDEMEPLSIENRIKYFTQAVEQTLFEHLLKGELNEKS